MTLSNTFNSIVFHIDVNSAFLSWEAVEQLSKGAKFDIRNVPSVIGGDDSFDFKYNRKGIVIAKSTSAKKLGIKTGETLFSAFQKYPKLLRFNSNFKLYQDSSMKMTKLIKEYVPKVHQYSIDECFAYLDGCDLIYKSPLEFANFLRNKIHEKLGFTVNIGISTNRLLAKMASDFKKPNLCHTLYKEEIPKKLWPLPVSDLFLVGKATLTKLHSLNIKTIGQLAKSDKKSLSVFLKSHASTIIDYANGVESKALIRKDYKKAKSIGNSMTLPINLTNNIDAHMILLTLVETSSYRLRKRELYANTITVGIKNSNFKSYTHQAKLDKSTDSTSFIYNISVELFNKMWKKDKIRLLSVTLSNLTNKKIHSKKVEQISILDLYSETDNSLKNFKGINVNNNLYNKNKVNLQKHVQNKHSRNIDYALDKIKNKYGKDFIKKAILCSPNKKYNLDKKRQRFPLTMPNFDDRNYYE